MNSLELVMGFYLTHPPGERRVVLAEAVDQAYLPLLNLLDEHPGVPICLHLSGRLIDFLEAERPEVLERIRSLAERGQVELVGGGYYGPVLSALPERDAAGQLRLSTRRHMQLFSVRPRGGFLPYGAWDPVIPKLFAPAGLEFAVADVSAFTHAGLELEQADSYWVTEGAGETLAVFADFGERDPVGPGMEPSRIGALLRRYASKGRKCLVWMLDAREFGLRSGTHALAWGRAGGWMPRLFGLIGASDHWLKVSSFSSLLRRFRPAGRLYLPTTVAPRWRVAPAAASGRIRQSEAPPVGFTGPQGSPLWQASLTRYEEANRLFQRIQRASLEVQRLTAMVRNRRAGDKPRMDLAPGLERAMLLLYQAQAAAPCTYDPWGGLYQGYLRHHSYASALLAEREVMAALKERPRFRVDVIDADGDRREEVVVTTPQFRALLDPKQGGALLELDSLALPGNLLNTLMRREEACLEPLRRDARLPALVDTASVALDSASKPEEEDCEVTVEEEQAGPKPSARQVPVHLLAADCGLKSCFADHFLGEQTTTENLRRVQYPEHGDFHGAEYELLRADANPTKGSIDVHFARDGAVDDGVQKKLARVVKRYRFFRERRGFLVQYEVSNRLREAFSTLFAVELNLNLDSRHGPAQYLEFDDSGRQDLTSTGSYDAVRQLSWVDLRKGFRVKLTVEPAPKAWHFPIQTLSQSAGGHRVNFQGVSLWCCWPLALWGEERKQFAFSFVVQTRGGG